MPRKATTGVQRSCEVMPNLAAPHLMAPKQSSRDSNEGSVSSDGSKWVVNTKMTCANYKMLIGWEMYYFDI